METPLDNVPPLFTSVAPLGAGFGLAAGCCGGGGVGAIGAAGSVFRLLENICIGKISFGASWDSYSQRSTARLLLGGRFRSGACSYTRGLEKLRLNSARARRLEKISVSSGMVGGQRRGEAGPAALAKNVRSTGKLHRTNGLRRRQAEPPRRDEQPRSCLRRPVFSDATRGDRARKLYSIRPHRHRSLLDAGFDRRQFLELRRVREPGT